MYYLPILNNYKEYISKKDNLNYILIQTKGILKENVTIKSIYEVSLKNRTSMPKSSLNWADLWSKRIDYMEYQIAELGKNKKEALDTFSFFSGMAENAISFIDINKIKLTNVKYSVCHNRIKYPNIALDYYNPLNLKLDYEIRDAAEYIKVKLMQNCDVSKDLNFIINYCDYNEDDLKLFFARLMFPTTYLDNLENIILSTANENIIDSYVDNVDNYLNMLQDAYLEIQKKVSLVVPDWLKVVS